MAIFNSYVCHNQRVNLHVPLVFLWFSHFPLVFLWFFYGSLRPLKPLVHRSLETAAGDELHHRVLAGAEACGELLLERFSGGDVDKNLWNFMGET